jgi:hypothetical protein
VSGPDGGPREPEVTMSKSTLRRCAFCSDYSVKRVRIGGADANGGQIIVGGQMVNAGKITPVCDLHLEMVTGARVESRVNGHAARQAAESAITVADDAAQDAAIRKARFQADAIREVIRTMTREDLEAITRAARAAAFRAGRSASMMLDRAHDDISDAFVTRVADRAANSGLADVAEAVASVNRAAIRQGLGYVNVTRQGLTGGNDSSYSATDAARDADGSDDQMAREIPTTDNGPADGYRVAGRILGHADVITLARENAGKGGPAGDAAREILAGLAA